MLATFSLKMGRRCGVLPSFMLGLCYFSIFWPSWPPPGAIWARCWKVFSSNLKVLISFWLEFEGFLTGFGLDFECFPTGFGGIVFLVLDGLVGSREALRILVCIERSNSGLSSKAS